MMEQGITGKTDGHDCSWVFLSGYKYQQKRTNIFYTIDLEPTVVHLRPSLIVTYVTSIENNYSS